VDGKADLHMHTVFSDGALTPTELLRKVKEAGLEVVSITDHDSVSGLAEATELGKQIGIEVIPGMELSATLGNSEVHILGYFMDYLNKDLLDSLAEFREQRLRRAERIIGKLNQMNIPLSMDSVMEQVSGDSVGRPHIANALVNGGHAQNYHQAFSKYIGDGRPAFEKKLTFSPEETIRLIAAAGGLSFLAHPGKSVTEEVLLRLIKSGLDGIEVIHPSHSPELTRHYRGIVNEYFLLESGGSDFHGGQKGDDYSLGQFSIPIGTVEMMRNRLYPS